MQTALPLGKIESRDKHPEQGDLPTRMPLVLCGLASSQPIATCRNSQADFLAPYVFRVAISDNRILECTETSVTYKYTPSKSKTP